MRAYRPCHVLFCNHCSSFSVTSAQLLTMSVNLSTMQKWTKDLDSLGEWLRYDESDRKVTRTFCALCTKHKDRLQALRNFSASFVDGISGTPLKEDNVNKHQQSDQHRQRLHHINCEKFTVQQFFLHIQHLKPFYFLQYHLHSLSG